GLPLTPNELAFAALLSVLCGSSRSPRFLACFASFAFAALLSVLCGSLHLCAKRISLFQTIDQPHYPILDQRHIEIDQQAQSPIREPQVGKHLLLVNGMNRLY